MLAGDVAAFGVMTLQQRLDAIAYAVQVGLRDPKTHEWVAQVVKNCPHSNVAGAAAEEIECVFQALKKSIKYRYHPRGSDRIQTLMATLRLGTGDCLPHDTLLLRRDGQFVPISAIEVGDEIMGDGRWTRVLNKWAKGPKPLLALGLNNCSTLRVTADHKLFVVPRKARSGGRTLSMEEGARRVSDPSAGREHAVDVRAGDVKIGHDLLVPERMPAGDERMDLDYAWLMGAFVADGWLGDHGTINISGRDAAGRKSMGGKRLKESQKQRAQVIAEAAGFKTRWDVKSLYIKSDEWAHAFEKCGRGAVNKRLPHLNVDHDTAAALLHGLSADAHIPGDGSDDSLVFSTVSKTLALQLRVLWRMQGRSTAIYWLENHGGFGKNPIARVVVRKPVRSDGHVTKPFARVRSIGQIAPEETFDIETDSGRFWLPETDVIVHNCDNDTAALITALHILGFQTWMIIMSADGETIGHIWAGVSLPRNAADPVYAPYDPKTGRGVVDLELTTGPGGSPDSAVVGWSVPHVYRKWWKTYKVDLT